MIESIAWPAVGLILGLVAIFCFRGPLVRKIDRITHATKDGFSFEQPQIESEPKNKALSFEEAMKLPITNAVLEREKHIRNKLQEIKTNTDSERIILLTRALASIGVEADFFKISNIIFGSQVSLLVQLSGTQQGLSRIAATILYEDAKKNFPEIYASRPFEQWIGYLESANLIKIESSNIDITQHGSDFLKYLVDARLAHARHG
jgi:hypothetical protein